MFSAENWNANSSSTTTDDQNNAGVYGCNYNINHNSSSYLASLMERLNFNNTNNYYQGNIALPNQNNVRTSAPDYTMNLFPTRYRCAQPVIREQAPALYDQYQTATSISSNGCREYDFQALNAQSAILYPSTRDIINSGFVNHPRPFDKTKILLEYILTNPYAAMVNPKSYRDFLWVLDACNKKVLNGVLVKMAQFSDETLIAVSCHKDGSKVIKKLITVAKRVPNVCLLPWVFAHRIVDMMNDQFGWHVVQMCFNSLDKLKNEPLYEEVVTHCLEIATGKYGCIAIQKCLDFMDSSPSQPWCGPNRAKAYSPKERLFMAISNHAALLARDQYGNFVLQFIIGMCPKECLKSIAIRLKPLYETLCTNNNGSYLVEKILGTPFKSFVAEALLESNRLVMLAQDEYGSYAIQTLLKQTKEHKPEDYQKLSEKLSQDVGTLESSLFGKNVVRFLKDRDQ